jgi:hypothetical protein
MSLPKNLLSTYQRYKNQTLVFPRQGWMFCTGQFTDLDLEWTWQCVVTDIRQRLNRTMAGIDGQKA